MPGVTRDRVREICRSLKIPYRERHLTVADLRRADELFITSTLKGIMPVGSVYGAQDLVLIEKSATGDVRTRRLLPVRFVPLLSGPR